LVEPGVKVEDEMVRFRMRIWRREEGQALVETAFAIPLLLIIILGVVYLSKAYNYKNDMTHLANEAARYATVNYNCGPGAGSGDCIEALVTSHAESQYMRDNVQVSICLTPDPSFSPYTTGAASPPTPSDPTGRVTATVTLPNYQVLPEILGFFGITKTLKATATMYQERQYPGNGPFGHYNPTPCT
jgi:Flp pilus assembly protein TadG